MQVPDGLMGTIDNLTTTFIDVDVDCCVNNNVIKSTGNSVKYVLIKYVHGVNKIIFTYENDPILYWSDMILKSEFNNVNTYGIFSGSSIVGLYDIYDVPNTFLLSLFTGGTNTYINLIYTIDANNNLNYTDGFSFTSSSNPSNICTDSIYLYYTLSDTSVLYCTKTSITGTNIMSITASNSKILSLMPYDGILLVYYITNNSVFISEINVQTNPMTIQCLYTNNVNSPFSLSLDKPNLINMINSNFPILSITYLQNQTISDIQTLYTIIDSVDWNDQQISIVNTAISNLYPGISIDSLNIGIVSNLSPYFNTWTYNNTIAMISVTQYNYNLFINSGVTSFTGSFINSGVTSFTGSFTNEQYLVLAAIKPLNTWNDDDINNFAHAIGATISDGYINGLVSNAVNVVGIFFAIMSSTLWNTYRSVYITSFGYFGFSHIVDALSTPNPPTYSPNVTDITSNLSLFRFNNTIYFVNYDLNIYDLSGKTITNEISYQKNTISNLKCISSTSRSDDQAPVYNMNTRYTSLDGSYLSFVDGSDNFSGYFEFSSSLTILRVYTSDDGVHATTGDYNFIFSRNAVKSSNENKIYIGNGTLVNYSDTSASLYQKPNFNPQIIPVLTFNTVVNTSNMSCTITKNLVMNLPSTTYTHTIRIDWLGSWEVFPGFPFLDNKFIKINGRIFFVVNSVLDEYEEYNGVYIDKNLKQLDYPDDNVSSFSAGAGEWSLATDAQISSNTLKDHPSDNIVINDNGSLKLLYPCNNYIDRCIYSFPCQNITHIITCFSDIVVNDGHNLYLYKSFLPTSHITRITNYDESTDNITQLYNYETYIVYNLNNTQLILCQLNDSGDLVNITNIPIRGLCTIAINSSHLYVKLPQFSSIIFKFLTSSGTAISSPITLPDNSDIQSMCVSDDNKDLIVTYKSLTSDVDDRLCIIHINLTNSSKDTLGSIITSNIIYPISSDICLVNVSGSVFMSTRSACIMDVYNVDTSLVSGTPQAYMSTGDGDLFRDATYTRITNLYYSNYYDILFIFDNGNIRISKKCETIDFANYTTDISIPNTLSMWNVSPTLLGPIAIILKEAYYNGVDQDYVNGVLSGTHYNININPGETPSSASSRIISLYQNINDLAPVAGVDMFYDLVRHAISVVNSSFDNGTTVDVAKTNAYSEIDRFSDFYNIPSNLVLSLKEHINLTFNIPTVDVNNYYTRILGALTTNSIIIDKGDVPFTDSTLTAPSLDFQRLDDAVLRTGFNTSITRVLSGLNKGILTFGININRFRGITIRPPTGSPISSLPQIQKIVSTLKDRFNIKSWYTPASGSFTSENNYNLYHMETIVLDGSVRQQARDSFANSTNDSVRLADFASGDIQNGQGMNISDTNGIVLIENNIIGINPPPQTPPVGVTETPQSTVADRFKWPTRRTDYARLTQGLANRPQELPPQRGVARVAGQTCG
jgi:hypothetical protein